MQDLGQDGALTIAETAAQLGVSADTVRRRIRRGELAAVQVPTPNGPAWRVTLSVLHSASSTLHSTAPSALPTLDGTHSNGAMHVEAPLLAQLLANTQAELVRTAAAAAMWQARAEHLGDQVEQLQRALPSPSPERPFLADSEGVPSEPTQTSSEAHNGRPWWAFWRGATV